MSTPPTHLRFLNPPDLSSPPGYTHVVEVTGGRTVYIAGQISVDTSFQVVGKDDFPTQAHKVFENLKIALAAVGADFTHVVKLNMYLLNISDLATLRGIRDLYLNTSHPPASTAVEVRKLALDGLLLEIEAVVSLPA